MKSFREIIIESLSYNIDSTRFNKIDISKYKKSTPKCKCSKNPKCCIHSYSIDNEIVFTYNVDTNLLTILKQGWQLMNIERGF